MKNKDIKLKRFNLLDLVIIILFAAILLGAFFRTEIIRIVSGEDTVEMEITFETLPLYVRSDYYLPDGDKIYLTDTDMLFGTVKDAKASYVPVWVQMSDGSYRKDWDENRHVVHGTVTVKGYWRDGVFSLAEGTVISVGDVLKAEGRQVAFDLKVTAMALSKE